MEPGLLLSTLLQHTRDVVIELDHAGNVRAWNPAAHRVLGWTEGEALGQPLTMMVAHDTWQARARELLHVLQSGIRVSGEFRLLARDGSERVLDLDALPTPEGGGLVIAADRTERARAAAKLQEIVQLERLPLVAGGVCHDLNNLLAGIDTAVQVARLQSERGASPVAALSDASRALERAAALTSQLGELASAGRRRTPTSLAATIRETATFSLVGRATSLELRIDDGLWPVEADAGQISQVVQNLVTNASEAMNGEGCVVVEAANEPDPRDAMQRFRAGPHVVVRVRDRGPGIAPELRARVFEPFFSTKSRGSGLGLATSASIARAHEGFLWLESEPGAGATFELWLPARVGA